jgi:hypothetical protein
MNRKIVPMAALMAAVGALVTASGDRHFSGKAIDAAVAGARPTGTRPEVQALAAQEVFTNVQILAPNGGVSVALSSDEVGDGLVAVYRPGLPASSPRLALGVSDLGAGIVLLFNQAGLPSFVFDGDSGVHAAGADIAEAFAALDPAPAGSVMVIDADNPRQLRVSTQPYDRRVVGVVSGANDYRPAMTLGQRAGQTGQAKVTLTGTVYCLVTNANGPIRAGDMLTTSAVPGHAMRATDPDASRGAILGKALEDLAGERGHLLVLATLQ